MGKYKVVLFNQETFEIVDDWVDGEIFDSEEEAQNYIDDIHDSMPEGEAVLRMCGRYDVESGKNYGYRNDDFVLQVEEIE